MKVIKALLPSTQTREVEGFTEHLNKHIDVVRAIVFRQTMVCLQMLYKGIIWLFKE